MLDGRRRLHGFSLTEVLIAVAIFLVAVTAFSGVLLQGKNMLSEDEAKMNAMNKATSLMEGFLCMSYADLEAGGTVPALSGCELIIDGKEISPARSKDAIPYYLGTVTCKYSSPGASEKKIALTGVIPYPTMHILTQDVNDTNRMAPDPPSCSRGTGSGKRCKGAPVTQEVLSVDIDVRVKSKLLIFYNITTIPEDAAVHMEPDDLLITQAYLKQQGSSIKQKIGIETGTPLLSQPMANNVVVVEPALSAGRYVVSVEWGKDWNSGRTRLRKANMIVVQVEDNT